MNLMAIQKIKELLSQTGHELSLEDFDVVAELDRRGDAVTNPSGDETDVFSIPVRLGKYLLCSPTISKMTWYNECALKWWEDSDVADYALGYMLQPHIKGSWLYRQTKKFTEHQVMVYARGLNVSPQAYEEAIQAVIGVGDGDGNNQDLYGPLIAFLTKEYHATPKYWADEADVDLIGALMKDHMDGVATQNAQASKQSKVAIAPVKTPRLVALNKFREQANLIEELWLKRN